MEEYIALARKSGRIYLKEEAMKVLRKLDYITKDNKPTWAAILLFGKEPNSFLVQAKVKIGRFKGSEILDDNLIEGTLLEQVEEAIKAIKKNIHVRYAIKGRITRKEVWDYPLEAIREAVLNAICHRDYGSNDFSVLKIHDSNINFWNPGGLRGNVTIQDLLKGSHNSQSRNKLITQYFYHIGQIEQYGSGIHRILDAFHAQRLPVPEFKEKQEGFDVMFEIHHRIKGFRISQRTDLTITYDMVKILEYCESPKSRAEIFKELRISNQTRNYMNKIVPLLGKGYLSLTIPTMPKNKYQKYITTEKGKEQTKFIAPATSN